MYNPGGPKNINTLIQEGYSTDTSSYLGRGWELLQQNMGGFIGFVVVVFLINVAIGGFAEAANLNSVEGEPPSALSSTLSFINSIIAIPLNAGFYVVALKLTKHRPTIFSDFFRGFNYFLPLFLASLVIGIFTVVGILLCISPGITYLVTTGVSAIGIILLILGILLALVFAIVLAVTYLFTFPLIIERKMAFWEAMETSRKVVGKRWFSFLGLWILLALINFAGMLLCFLGLIITVPLWYCSVVAAYEDVFGLSLSSED